MSPPTPGTFAIPVKEWLRQSETFTLPCDDLSNTDDNSLNYGWGALAASKVAFATHLPNNGDFIQRVHDLGVKCFPYVSFSYAPRMMLKDPAPTLTTHKLTKPPLPASHPYMGVDFSSGPGSHLFAVENGAQTPAPLGWQYDGTGSVYLLGPPPAGITCPNNVEYQDAMVNWVQYLVEQLGADGIWIDVVPSRTDMYHGGDNSLNLRCDCAKPDTPAAFQHDHIYSGSPDPSDDQLSAYRELLGRVRTVLGPSRTILGSSGLPMNRWYDNQPYDSSRSYLFEDLDEGVSGLLVDGYLDGDSIENYVDLRWRPWVEWHDKSNALRPLLEAGRAVLVIAPEWSQNTKGSFTQGVADDWYASKKNPMREHLYLTYATARLAGFVWTSRTPLSEPEGAVLFQHQLGLPRTDEQLNDMVAYRVFERGVVAVNFGSTAQALPTPLPLGTAVSSNYVPPAYFVDLFDDPRKVIPAPPQVQVQVPAQSGRVYLFAADPTYALGY